VEVEIETFQIGDLQIKAQKLCGQSGTLTVETSSKVDDQWLENWEDER